MSQSQIIQAPSRDPRIHPKSIFLAGTTTKPDWRDKFSASLADWPITIYNPLNLEWDKTWKEDILFEPFRQQVEWELEMQDQADVLVVYFGSDTDAPISLLEFGLRAREGGSKVVVYAADRYRKKGNVQVVCRRFGVKMADSFEALQESVVEMLGLETSSSV